MVARIYTVYAQPVVRNFPSRLLVLRHGDHPHLLPRYLERVRELMHDSTSASNALGREIILEQQYFHDR